MDKESLKKHQFWYLLGGAGVLLLILIPVTLFGMAGGADEKKNYDSTLKGVQGAKQPKNETFLPKWREHQKWYSDQKDGVWKKAWETQKDLYIWPEGSKSIVEFNKRMAYPAEVKQLTADERREYKRIYARQFRSDDPQKDLEKSIAPAYFNGGASGYEVIMGPTLASGQGAVGEGGRPKFGDRPDRPGLPDRPGFPGAPGVGPGAVADGIGFTALFKNDKVDPQLEEIWILQEDFWVKKEMLRIIREVQRGAGRCKLVEEKEGVRRFRNGNWELKLVVKDKALSAESTIENISPTKAPLPMGGKDSKALIFRLVQGDSPPFDLKLTGEPVKPGEPLPLLPLMPKDSHPEQRLDLSKSFDVEQVFEWSNAPVRRIDALRTAKQSHRTAKSSLVQYPPFKPAEDPNASSDTKPAVTPTAPGAPGPTAAPPGGERGEGGLDKAPAGPTNATEVYGLERNRYIIATDQSRHLPIAMVLIVEQAHVSDLLIAIANSPLRIQTTQVAFHEMPVRAPSSPGSEPGPDQPRERPDQALPSDRPTKTFPGGPGGPLGPGGQPTARVDEPDTSLVELTVYGIATLYERFKERDPNAPQTPGSPQPGTPPGK
jgi:hypothetical protein